MGSHVEGEEAERTGRMRMDDSGPYVLVVTKGDGNTGQGQVTLQGFQRWSPSGCSAVGSQRSSPELLELGPQKPWGMRPEDPGFGFHASLGPWLLNRDLQIGDPL